MSDTPEWTARFVYGEETLDALRSEIERLRGLLREALPFVKWSGIASARDVWPRIEAALAGAADRDGAAKT